MDEEQDPILSVSADGALAAARAWTIENVQVGLFDGNLFVKATVESKPGEYYQMILKPATADKLLVLLAVALTDIQGGAVPAVPEGATLDTQVRIYYRLHRDEAAAHDGE